MSKKVSREERALMKRVAECEFDTDRLGPGSLMTQQSHINASRMVLTNSQLSQMVSIKDPEMPLVPTGFENVLAQYSHMLDETDGEYEIVAKFQKNEYNYVLIGFDRERKMYHAWKRIEMEEHSEGFSTRYNNTYIDSLEPGDIVPKGVFIKKSTNFDKYMNYQYGKNVNVVYMVSPFVYEDGILIMNGAEEMFNTYRAHTVEINLADNEILLNWFGDEDHYQGIPLVGEKTRKGYAAIVRRIDNATAPYSLKKSKLRKPELGDRKYYITGRVVDIEILTNKDPKKMLDVGASHLINQLYNEQQTYYRDLYRYMRKIADDADNEGYTYSDDFSIICEEAHDFVDSSAYFADVGDNVYGNTKIILHLLDEEKLIVGSKLVGRSGNKGVVSRIIPPEQSWHMEDGTPIHFVVSGLGIVGRLNPAQLNEHSCNELGQTAVRAMKLVEDVDKKADIVYQLLYLLNKDEAKAWRKWFKKQSLEHKIKTCKRIEKKGIKIVQPPIDNVNILHLAEAYEHFPANFQHIVFADGRKSLKSLLCAKMFYIRLKQDPLEKYSSRSRGPVNPVTTLPAKSNQKKKFLSPYSDVSVRLSEMDLEILQTMVNHPEAIADFMMENSTSFEAKLLETEQITLGDPDSEVNIYDVEITGKKNIELIEAMINVLGTRINMEVEEAPEGEWFES